jgi:conjugal transfer pilus assembly protein TraE
MQLHLHARSISELSDWVKYLSLSNAALLFLSISLAIMHFTENKIVIVQVPNGGGSVVESKYQKYSIDRGSQKAIILATINAISQINTVNFTFQKEFVQNFLAPEVFTNISNQIDINIRKMTDQRELGSFYFDFKEYQYDPNLDRHFIKGEIHTVNSVKNTSQPWVYEVSMKVENYRPLITSLTSYQGNDFHNSTWIESHSRNN